MPKQTMTKKPKIKTRKKTLITHVPGMHDILPKEFEYWDYCYSIVQKYADIYNFLKIETPVLEKTDLFSRAIGKETDIVKKEMFSFVDQGKEKLTLRPEWTASVMRAYIENGLSSLAQPVKLYSSGPLFRRERPQAGRFRQFHQTNFEIIGNADPVIDAEVIFVAWNILKKIGLENVVVKINSIGTPENRKEYIDVLIDYFNSKKHLLSAEQKARLKRNPLRLLDSKDEKLKGLIADAPQIIDYLDAESNEHFKNVLEYLDEVEVTYHLDHTLVRGLDYYTRTTYEFVTFNDTKNEYSKALAGGGRYDGLSEELGGKEIPGIGVALGMERIIDEVKENKIPVKRSKKTDVFLIQLGELAKKKSLKIFNDLIEAKISVQESFHRDSIKSQLKQADKHNVRLSLILGQKEALEDTIIVRDMISGIQEIVPLKNLADELKKRLKKPVVTKKEDK
ncbi:histidine--tRNA ligase [Patescibacteria group bacterium]|nr:histidine--tRNA ligase [Patescibacteria group bacterium]